MSDDKPMTYRDSGVDIDAKEEALRRIKDLVVATRTAGVRADLGSFGGVFAPPLDGVESPLLVASADGVGTKLQVAFMAGVHDTVGRDLVHHCINDILVQGARPLFFMDYVATGRLDPRVLAEVVEGVAAACKEQGCALLGGETAEMPGFYGDDEYDVAGFIVGIVAERDLLGADRVRPGDRLIGLPSNGLHTNGYSLARKIVFDRAGLAIDQHVEALGGRVCDVLLAPHVCYLEALSGPIRRGRVHALAHITGGGLTDNLPRSLPAGCAARVRRDGWPRPPIFDWLGEHGGVDEDEMYRVFNMGVGMVVIAAPDDAAAIGRRFDDEGRTWWEIGEVIEGDGGVVYER